jgi:hypothetical protein
MAVKLTELVEKGEISTKAVAELGKLWVASADELYCQLRAAVNYDVKEVPQKFADILGVPADKLSDFMEYLTPYVSDNILNPAKPGEQSMGCQIDPDRLAEMARKWQALGDPMEVANAHRQTEIEAMSMDPDFRGMYFKDFETNHKFRDWILEGQPFHGYEPEAKQKEMVEKQRKLVSEYSERVTGD